MRMGMVLTECRVPQRVRECIRQLCTDRVGRCQFRHLTVAVSVLTDLMKLPDRTRVHNAAMHSPRGKVSLKACEVDFDISSSMP